MNWINRLGILTLISSYVVFAFALPHANVCPVCGKCIDNFPNDYYFMSFCAGAALIAFTSNVNHKDKVYETGVIYFSSMLLIIIIDRFYSIINHSEYYPLLFLSYTTALCMGILLVKLILRYIRTMY